MRSFLILAALAVTIGSVVAPNPAIYPRTSSSLRVFEALRTIPQGWKKVDAPAASARLRLRIALQEPNHDLFEKTLFAVSDPNHAKYGQHLKRHEVKALIKPRAESTEAVISWLRGSGVAATDIENDGEWVSLNSRSNLFCLRTIGCSSSLPIRLLNLSGTDSNVLEPGHLLRSCRKSRENAGYKIQLLYPDRR